MSDLISRKAVLDIINKHRCDTNRIEENVLNLPTTYDVDKVVEQLEEIRNASYIHSINQTSVVNECVAIVKEAVKDE
jgi:hypothetical protein